MHQDFLDISEARVCNTFPKGDNGPKCVKLDFFFVFYIQNTRVLTLLNFSEPSDVSPGGVSSYARL